MELLVVEGPDQGRSFALTAQSVIGLSTQLIRSRSFLPVTSMGCSAFFLRRPSSSLLPPSTLATSFLTNVPS